MAKSKKNDYFKLAEEQVLFCVKASDLLEQIICSFDSENIEVQRAQMHEIENQADELHHDILNRLTAEFITPIDQEDILGLVQIIDDVTDALDEVVLDFYMYNVTALPDGTAEMSKLVNKCVKALYEATKELKNFKKPEKLRSLLVEVNHVESAADAHYTESIRKLFTSDHGAKDLIAGKAIFESLENCCDLCEHAADVVEQIIIKNT